MIRPLQMILFCLLLAGCKGSDNTKEAAKEPENVVIDHNAAGEAVITMNPETQKQIALKIAPLAPADHSAEVTAYGTVLDPTPLVALQGTLATDNAAVAASKPLAERARALFNQSENVSRKAMEAAENDLRANEIKLENDRNSLQLEWGGVIAALDDDARQKLVRDLVARRTFLIRVDIMAGETVPEMPVAARLEILGEKDGRTASVWSSAPKADAKTLGQGFFLRVDETNNPLLIGSAVKAFLQLSGPARHGVLLPESAVLRAEGKTWVYLVGSDNKFTRHQVTLEAPADGGWFSSGLSPGDAVVIAAGQILLSEEQKSQIKID